MYRRMSIDDEDLLKKLYVRANIPTDQYKSRPDALLAMTREFNAFTERSDSPDDLVHYMVNERKNGKWPKLGAAHRKMKPISGDMFTQEEWAMLDRIYLDLNKGSDNYAYDGTLRRELMRRFSATSGCVLGARELCRALEIRRKAGLLPTLKEKPEIPFADIDSVAM